VDADIYRDVNKNLSEAFKRFGVMMPHMPPYMYPGGRGGLLENRPADDEGKNNDNKDQSGRTRSEPVSVTAPDSEPETRVWSDEPPTDDAPV